MNIKYLSSNVDEGLNTLTHGLGFLFALVGSIALLYCTYGATDSAVYVGIIVYAIGMIFVYLSSTLYHATAPSKLKEHLRTMDHISIFFMIAGTHTPIVVKYFNTNFGSYYLIVLWSLVGIGVLGKLCWPKKVSTLDLVLYIAMGWMSITLFPDILFVIEPNLLQLLVFGGVLYSIGIIFFKWESLKYHHPIWHTFVLAGSVAHFVLIYKMVLG